jgi:hypothetical protein
MKTKRYELVEGYPGGPKVGTIVKHIDGNNYIGENSAFIINEELLKEWPRFWQDADRDKRTMTEKMQDFLDSSEGEECIKRFGEQLEAKDRQNKRDMERFERMVKHTGLDELMDKITHKYNSKTYEDREIKCGFYEPREELNDVVFKYFSEHGEETQVGTNMFMDTNYRLGKYLVGLMIGQGSYIKVQTYEDALMDDSMERLNIRLMQCRSGSGLNSYGYSFIQIGGMKGDSGDNVGSEKHWSGNYDEGETVVDCRGGECKRISKDELKQIIEQDIQEHGKNDR